MRARPAGVAEVAEVITPAPLPEWRQLLAADPDATVQQTPEYASAVRSASGTTDVSRLYRLADGRRLLVPLVRRRIGPGVAVDADYPRGYGHGGLLADGGLRDGDVAGVLADLRRRDGRTRVVSTSLDGHHPTADRWPAAEADVVGVIRSRRRVEVVDLSDGFDAVWRHGFSKAVRRNVARAEKLGVRLECDTTGRLVPAFYEVYLGWVAERAEESPLPASVTLALARRRESLAKFRSVSDLLGSRCRVWIAWYRDRPVACSMTLWHGRHAMGWRGYSIKSVAAPVAANTAISVAEIEDAALEGCQTFDLGQSSGLPGLLRYKASLGARPREVVDLRIESPSITRLRAARSRAQGSLERLLAARSLGPAAAK